MRDSEIKNSSYWSYVNLKTYTMRDVKNFFLTPIIPGALLHLHLMAGGIQYILSIPIVYWLLKKLHQKYNISHLVLFLISPILTTILMTIITALVFLALALIYNGKIGHEFMEVIGVFSLLTILFGYFFVLVFIFINRPITEYFRIRKNTQQ